MRSSSIAPLQKKTAPRGAAECLFTLPALALSRSGSTGRRLTAAISARSHRAPRQIIYFGSNVAKAAGGVNRRCGRSRPASPLLEQLADLARAHRLFCKSEGAVLAHLPGSAKEGAKGRAGE